LVATPANDREDGAPPSDLATAQIFEQPVNGEVALRFEGIACSSHAFGTIVVTDYFGGGRSI